MSWIWKFFITVCLALISHRVIKIVIVSGFFKPQYNHTPGPCELVNGVVNGSEDIHTLSNGVALISSGLHIYGTDEGVKGQILTFDFHNPAAGAQEVTLQGVDRQKFIPVGLSVYEERKKGVVTVFIINRDFRMSDVSVEVFDFKQQDNLLIHKKTITHTNIYTPNNIVATSPNTFYLTNDGYTDWAPIRLAEILLALPSGSIVYYDGKDVQQVAGTVLTPNGIALSHTRKYLYVASSLAQSIDVYEIQHDAAIVFVKSIHLATLVDNLTVDPDTGDVWAACAPNLLAGASQEGRARGQAQVLRIAIDRDLNAEIHEVLMDDGHILKGSSVASIYQRKLLVGTVMGRMMFCKIQAF